ncbi:MAG: HAMP domain-containing protein, partial [Halovenus sp.]
TENIRQASEDVADSAQRISDDAHQQQNRLQTVVSDIDTVIAAFERLLDENPDLDIDEELDQLREFKGELEAAAETSDGLLTETENVAGAAQEQAAELNEVSARADRLKRYAQPLGEIVNKFDTDEEHEFVFSTGPTESPTETGDD